MARNYVSFKDKLSPIDQKPTHIWLSDRWAWRVELDRKLIVELGRDEVDLRLKKFVDAYPHTLAIINRPVDYVDLRYPNGFAVRLPGYVPKAKKKEAA